MRTIEEIKAEIAAGNFIMGTCLNQAKYNLFNRLAWELIAAREAEIARRVFAVWSLIHEANMAKDGGGKREDGKILKPDGWQPPDVAGLIEQQKGEGYANNRAN